MTRKMKTPVLAGTGADGCSSSKPNSDQYTPNTFEIQHLLQARRLRHRFGLSHHHAGLVAYHAFGGHKHG